MSEVALANHDSCAIFPRPLCRPLSFPLWTSQWCEWLTVLWEHLGEEPFGMWFRHVQCAHKDERCVVLEANAHTRRDAARSPTGTHR